ncbi:MAG: class II aldolase/adducin family protein [Pseudomonadota bacterium]
MPIPANERKQRQAVIDGCLAMNAAGLNQGTSGNISVRFGDAMLITPSAIPYEEMKPAMLARMPLDGKAGAWEGPKKPSSEWRFHLDILKARPDANAVVHLHAPYCTTLAVARKPIPACHYMVAAFGGHDVRCAGYARFGTQALSKLALEALEDRTACLLANHGMIAIGASLDEALWRAVELETIARQYHQALLIGGPKLLTRKQIDETLAAFANYGRQEKSQT